jgi:dTDP-4-amino-4,6-dideoxygalactose transaminase
MPALLGGPAAFNEPLYVTRPRVPDRARFSALVDRVFEARWFTNDGALVRHLEAALTRLLDAGACAAFCNGTVALQAAVKALDLTGRVITTPFTFPATVHAIQWMNLEPVFCDIDRRTYNLDPARVAEAMGPEVSGVLPVHVFGAPCDVEAFETLAARTGVKILYDAAHAFGVRAKGRSIVNWGDLSVLSFHATKLFHSAEGGAIAGPSPAMRERLSRLRNFGIVNEDEVAGTGTNGKMSELHAALGLALLDDHAQEVEARGRLVARYRAGLEALAGLTFQQVPDGTVPNHSYFTVEVDAAGFGLSRDELHVALKAERIIARKYFFPLCSTNAAYAALPSAHPSRLPHATALAAQVLSLPLFGELDPSDVDRIVDAIARIQSKAAAVRSALAGRLG